MAKHVALDDALWKKIEKVLPVPAPRNHLYAGRKPVDSRKVISGIVYVLANKIPWEDLPQDLGLGSGMTCWRRMRLLQEQGVWAKVAALLRRHLPEGIHLDLERSNAPKRIYNTKSKKAKTGKAARPGKIRAAKVVRAARKASASRESRAAAKANTRKR